ncbi:MAG TPA: glycosyltransferase family 87 protein [Terriglobales bacterium]
MKIASVEKSSAIKGLTMLALAIMMSVSMWINCRHRSHMVERKLDSLGFAARNFSDLYPRWLGSRELLLHKRDPYSQTVTQEIQQGYYGRPIGSENSYVVDEQRFAYPLYIVFLLAPVVYVPFSVAKLIFIFVLPASAIVTVLVWFKLIGIDIDRLQKTSVLILVIASLPYISGLFLQQLSIVVAFFIATALWCIARDKLLLSGALFALSTIKPQLSFFLICWTFVWAFSKWQSRKLVIYSFMGFTGVLCAASQVLLPGWFAEFIAGLGPYLRYTHGRAGILVLLGNRGGMLAILFMACIVSRYVWKIREEDSNSKRFFSAVLLVLTFTDVVVPSVAPHTEVLLLPAYLLFFKESNTIQKARRLARSLVLGSWLVVLWPFATSFLLVLCFYLWSDKLSLKYWNLPVATNPLVPVVVFAALVPLLRSRATGSANQDAPNTQRLSDANVGLENSGE